RADMKDLGFDIEFSDVSFSYGDNGDDALKGVSFKVHTGETVALVGHSGAGKSTCINLLLRFWDVRTGEIRIGSRNIKNVSLESLRNTTSAVLQEVYLFNTTIRENIKLGSPNASDKEVEVAARHALAHEFISALPDGYDTITGEKGAQLSGGQRQRIAIARAILRDAPILVLDEAVSNLDTENEHDIQRALKHLRKGRTTLVIAHRLSTILSADRLVVLDRGRVAEAGAHEELVNRDGVYRELFA
nr:ATP-binding cassette domain-containing protein [Actinomycetota bacterium]